MQSRLLEITHQIDVVYQKIEEKNLSPLSAEVLLRAKLLAYKTLIQSSEPTINAILNSLSSIELALRAMNMLSKLSTNQLVNNIEIDQKDYSRFARSTSFIAAEQHSMLPLTNACQQLQEMIHFYCIPRSKQNGISRCLGETYSQLFAVKSPIFLCTFNNQNQAELFIKNIQSSTNNEILTYFTTLTLQDYIAEKKDENHYFHVPLSYLQKKSLENAGLLVANNTLHSSTFNNIAFTSLPTMIQMEIVTKETPDTLFFELTEKGLQIYCEQISNINIIKYKLTQFGFNKLDVVINASPPAANGFHLHQQYLIIAHTQVGKLLKLHYLTNKPQEFLNDLYKAKKLNLQKCLFLDRRATVLVETDAEFYKSYFEKLQTIKTKYLSSYHPIKLFPLIKQIVPSGAISNIQADLIQFIFKNFREDDSFDIWDHRRYILALLELQNQFYNLSESNQKQLPAEIYNLVKGLKSILILPENDESAGVSGRLSRHFSQLYEIEDMQASAPYVLFEAEGCCFYFNTLFSLNMVANQLLIHGIDVKKIEQESLSRANDHKVPSTFSHKLIISPYFNRQLLHLARFHPANIDTCLKQAYSNQGLNFTSSLLQSSIIYSTSKPDLIKPSYAVATLANGEQILQLQIESKNVNKVTNMGHVIIMLDDSSSMGKQKMEAATQACVDLIKKLPDNTEITLLPFCAHPLFNGMCVKSKLPIDWEFQVRSVKANGSTPLVQTIVKAAASLSPRCFTPMSILKRTTFILLTDGQGDAHETAEEILQAIKTGIFRGMDVSQCNHALGTPELPNHATFPLIAVGIGNDYDSKVIDGLSNFAGNYHIRTGAEMHSDLAEMVESVTQTFGFKMGPVYAGLLSNKTGEFLITIEIDMMLPTTARCVYTCLPKGEDLQSLKAIISVESELTSICLNRQDNQAILVDYFNSKVDTLFKHFTAKVTRVNHICSTLDRGTYINQLAQPNHSSTNSTVTVNSLFSTEKESEFADIQKQLNVIKKEIQDNKIMVTQLLNRIESFEIFIKQAENHKLDLNSIRREQAERSRIDRGLVNQVDKIDYQSKQLN